MKSPVSEYERVSSQSPERATRLISSVHAAVTAASTSGRAGLCTSSEPEQAAVAIVTRATANARGIDISPSPPVRGACQPASARKRDVTVSGPRRLRWTVSSLEPRSPALTS